MTEAEAKEIIEDMRNTAAHDTVIFHQRLAEYRQDYVKDPHELVAGQIRRTEARLEKRVKEAAALAIALTKF